MDGSCSDDSEPEEERAGGGPGPCRRRAGAGGPDGGSGPTTSIRRAGGALTDRMTAETLRCTSGTRHVESTYARGPLRLLGSGIDSF